MENWRRPILVKSSAGAMALTNDSVSKYLEGVQKHQFTSHCEEWGGQSQRDGWEERGVTTYLSPSSLGLAWVSNNLFHLFSSDS